MSLGTNYKRNIDYEQLNIDFRIQRVKDMAHGLVADTKCNGRLAFVLSVKIIIGKLTRPDALEIITAAKPK